MMLPWCNAPRPMSCPPKKVLMYYWEVGTLLDFVRRDHTKLEMVAGLYEEGGLQLTMPI